MDYIQIQQTHLTYLIINDFITIHMGGMSLNHETKEMARQLASCLYLTHKVEGLYGMTFAQARDPILKFTAGVIHPEWPTKEEYQTHLYFNGRPAEF